MRIHQASRTAGSRSRAGREQHGVTCAAGDGSDSRETRSGSQGRGLAEVSAQPDRGYATVDFGELFQQFVGTVCAAVINKDELVVATKPFHDLLQAALQFNDVHFLVVKRNNNGNRGTDFEIRHAVPSF